MADDGRTAVRPAVEADAAEIAAVQSAAWKVAYTGILPPALLEGMTVERQAPLWARWIAGPDFTMGRVLVAEGDGRIVGFASHERRYGKAGWLVTLYVAPGTHGRGYGRRLVEAVAEAERATGAIELRARCVARNPFRNFYPHTGWQRVGMRLSLIGGTPVREIVYRLPLDPASPPPSETSDAPP